jgi:hypothetical protein
MINQRLSELYRSKYETLQQTLLDLCNKPGSNLEIESFSAPLLINFVDDSAVESADFRIMFFGQETN